MVAEPISASSNGQVMQCKADVTKGTNDNNNNNNLCINNGKNNNNDNEILTYF